MTAAAIFTASQIAAALGMKRQAAQWHLRSIVATDELTVAGNRAAAWTLAQLPAQLLTRLDVEATRQNCKGISPEQRISVLFAMPRRQWQPPFPLDTICAADIRKAKKLQAALQPWLLRQHGGTLSPAEMEAAGVQDYCRIFGNAITARYWRELFTRTIQRDNGAEQFNRLEIYLPERVKQTTAPAAVVSQALAEDFAELESYLSACGNPHDPSKKEREGIWTAAFDKFTSLVQQGTPEKSAARRVRQYLSARASFLAASRDALLKAFNRKLDDLRREDGDVKALRDGRAENGERFELPENDRDLLIHSAVFTYRGDIAPAWRELLRGQKFSPETKSRYAGQAVNKSHVPATVRESIAPEVEILTVMHQGRRAFDAIKGHVTRNYDGIASLQCMSADDVTLPVYMSFRDDSGKINIKRGQLILWIDWRTGRVLAWALEPRESYSSRTIRSLFTHVCAKYGVPQVLYFERGLWQSATLLKGKTDPHTFTEISQGLREFGVKFIHAIRPRTKTVERIIGMIQDLMGGEPGYCGRDERRDAPETLRKQMAQVEAGKAPPSQYFYSFDFWNQRIGEIIETYNTTPQQGHMLAGLSPDQAFEKFMNQNNPPLQFTAPLRYLLANDKRIARVTLNGVTIQIGKQKYNYRGREISHLTGREVLAWFDPENPETITVTNPDRTNPICVALSKNPNALESLIAPDSGTLGRELARIEGQASHMKTRFNVVKAKFQLPQRKLLAAAQVVELGEQITAQKNEIAETQNRQRRKRGQALKFAERTGIAVPEHAQENLQPDDARFLSEFLNGKESQ